MRTCYQTPTQTVWEHGQSVLKYYVRIQAHLDGDPEDPSLRLPGWCSDYRRQLLDYSYGADVAGPYTVYHDCGKPHCRVVDADGKQHFPDHAAVSRRVWLEAGGDPVVGALIGWDMVICTMAAADIPTYLAIWTHRDAGTLLLAGLAEIHSNADLFGGTESVSFKTKFKQLDRRGRALLKSTFGGGK